MSKVSFEDIGAVIATFAAQDSVKPGQVVKIAANGQVGACSAKDAFAGQAQSVRGGFAGVQVKGVSDRIHHRHGESGPGQSGGRRHRRCAGGHHRRRDRPGGQRGFCRQDCGHLSVR